MGKKAKQLATTQHLLRTKLAQCRCEVGKLTQVVDLHITMLNAVDQLVMLIDLQGQPIYYNQASEKLIGYLLKETSHQSFWELLAPQEQESVRAGFERSLVDKVAVTHESNWVAVDGSNRCIVWTYTPFFNAENTIEYVIAVGNDLSKRQQQEEELQKLREALARQLELTEIAQRQEKAAQEWAKEQKTVNEELKQRDQLLEVTAISVNALLMSTNFDQAVNTAVEIIGESLKTDRVNVIENFAHPVDSSLYWRVLYEWNSPGTVPQFSDPNAASGSYEEVPWLYELFRQGRTASYRIEEAPEPFRSEQVKVGVKSTHIVPIHVEGKWWGVFGLDDCREAKHRSPAELAVLKIAADCIGSAIQRDCIRRQQQQAECAALLEREQAAKKRAAELEEHNRLLSERDLIMSATASAANALLTLENLDQAVNTALQIIGEALDVDRVCVGEHHDEPAGKTLGYVRYLYEWDSPHVVRQIEQPSFVEISYEGLEQLNLLVSQGYIFDGVIDEMPEPFRSEQKKLGVQSSCAIPIMVDGKYWGVVGFDDCREAKRRSIAEFAVLKTAAACIGSAIQRDRIRRQREAAERSMLLERAKAATERAELLKTVTSVANQLLRSSDYTTVLPNVLQTLGEAARADRCGLVQNVIDSTSGKPAVKIHAECCRVGIQASTAHTPELETALLWEYFLEFQHKLAQSQTVNFLVNDLSEPVRSILLNQGKVAITMVPIVVQGQFWGVFGFDYCREVQLDDLDDEADNAIFAIAVDSIAAVIERQAKDEALRESEKRYRTLFELSNEGIYRFDLVQPIPTSLPVNEQIELAYRHYRIAEVNNTFVSQYGLNSPDEMIGKGLADLHIEGSEVNWETNRTLIENGYQIRNAESEEITVDGKHKYFLNNIVCDVRDGYVWGGWCMQTDITELKQAQQALLQAEQERAAELAKANDALKKSLDSLATEPSLDKFLGQVLTAIAQQFQSPLTEYWYHPSDTAYVGTICWQGRVYNRDEIALIFPTHAGLDGFKVPPALIDAESPQKRQHTLIYQDHTTNPFTKHLDWVANWLMPKGLVKEINVPMLLGNNVIGALIIRLSRQHQFTSEQIELAQALAHQATLAVQLTRLAEDAKQVAIAREQEKAAQNRALQLAKANEVLRRSLTHLTQENDLGIYLNQVLLTIVHQVGAVLGHIFIYNAKSNELVIKVRVAEGRILTEIPPDEPEMFRTPFSADITPAYRHLCQSGEVLCLQKAQLIDIEQPDYFWTKNLEWHRHRGHTEVAALALIVGNQPVGFLGLAFKGRPPLEPEEKELVQALAQQATLAIQLTRLSAQSRESAVLEERNRMAREIHDTLAQAFTGVIIQLEAAEEIVATQPNEAQAHLIRASSLAREGLLEARRSVRALRSEALESNDLPKALRRLVQQMTDGLALRAEICVIGTPRRLPTEIESNLLRIGQEALTNALRHALAQTIQIKVLFEAEVVHLQIIDDGQGFEPQLQANSGCGIIGMQERSQQIGAELILNSRTGQGTEIKVSVPTP